MTALQEVALEQLDGREDVLGINTRVQHILDAFGVEVTTGHLAVKNGTSTELTEFLSSLIGNPIQTTLEMWAKHHTAAKAIVHNVLVKTHLLSCADIVQAAYKTKTTYDDLHYSIVLRKDTTKNRMKVFSFFDKYDTSGLSVHIPVYFRFIAPEREDKIIYSEVIKLEQ